MLVLGRKLRESVVIVAAGKVIRVSVQRVPGTLHGEVELGFEADRDVEILRAELTEQGPRMNYKIEGMWSGYTADQKRVAHREYTSDEERAAWCRSNQRIVFTDGTTLDLSVSPSHGREPGDANLQYASLISKCVRHDQQRVSLLPA